MSWTTRCCGTFLLFATLPALAQAPHVDLADYPSPQANWDRFHRLQASLVREFDGICGDTFCEGEYSNYRVLTFRCAVQADVGTVRHCAWGIVASELQVEPVRGEVQVDNARWICPVTLGEGVPVEVFHATLEQEEGAFEPFPGTDVTVFDTLPTCLGQPGNAGRAA
ncbi:TPA: hypothetical protein ACXNP2_003430 [Stenotrophomonas maltophilia]